MAQAGSAPHAAPSSTMLVTCRACGDVVVAVGHCRVSRGTSTTGPAGWYGFDCPSCTRRARVTADDHLLGLLVLLGARDAVLAELPGQRRAS